MVVLIVFVGRSFISPITVMTRNHLDMDVSLKSHSARLSKKRKKEKKKESHTQQFHRVQYAN